MKLKLLHLIITIFCILFTVAIQSCGSNQEKSIESQLASMNKEELIQHLTNEGFIVLSPNDENLYYANTDSLFFYDIKNNENKLVFQKDSTKINLYELKLNISRDGDIEVVKEYVNKRWITVALNLNLVKGIKDTQKFDTQRIYGKDGFIIEYDDNTALINPKEDGSIDAIIIYGDDAEHESYVEYDVPVVIGYNFVFDWSDIPSNIRPSLINEALTFGLVQDAPSSNHPRYYFHYSARLNADGTIEQSEFVDFAHLDYTLDKALLKNKAQLKAYIEQYTEDMTLEYNNYIRQLQFDRAVNDAKTSDYFINLYRNKNLFNESIGKAFYLQAEITEVSEKYDDGYYVDFKNSTMWDRTYGMSSDDRFATLELPAKVIIKATLENGFDGGLFGNPGVKFKDIELIGIYR